MMRPMPQRRIARARRHGQIASRELQMLTEACAANFRSGRLPDPRTFNDVDWAQAAALARRHRVQALVWAGLAGGRGEIPEAVAEGLRGDASAIAARNLAAAAELARLKSLWSAKGPRVLWVKGLTLGALAYQQPMLKMSVDIDILVAFDDLEAAARLLRDAGYDAAEPRGLTSRIPLGRWHRAWKESVWRHRDKDIWLDLHSQLADRDDLIPTIGMESPVHEVEVTPGLTLPTLADEELFAYLCVHGASSAWFRLKWVTDLAAFLDGRPRAEIERLYQRSQQLGAWRAAAQALLLADRLYGTLEGSHLRRQLMADRANRRMLRIALRMLLADREPSHSRFGTALIHYNQLRLAPGIRPGIRLMVRQFRKARLERR